MQGSASKSISVPMTCAEFIRNHRKNSGSGADVENGFIFQIERFHHARDERCGCVIACTKSAFRFENEKNGVGFGRSKFNPRRTYPNAMGNVDGSCAVSPPAIPIFSFFVFGGEMIFGKFFDDCIAGIFFAGVILLMRRRRLPLKNKSPVHNLRVCNDRLL